MLKRFKVLLLLSSVVAIAGCGARQVPIKSDNYPPHVKSYTFPANPGIYISSVWNKDASTVKWGYKDADKRLWYMFDTSIEDYIQRSLSTAFFKTGLNVYNSAPLVDVNVSDGFRIMVNKDSKEQNIPAQVNDLRIDISSITSRAVAFKLSVYRGEQMIYNENLVASLDETASGKRSDVDFQAYAYRLTDKMVETILSEKRFVAAIAK